MSVSETCLWQGVAGDEAGEKDRLEIVRGSCNEATLVREREI